MPLLGFFLSSFPPFWTEKSVSAVWICISGDVDRSLKLTITAFLLVELSLAETTAIFDRSTGGYVRINLRPSLIMSEKKNEGEKSRKLEIKNVLSMIFSKFFHLNLMKFDFLIFVISSLFSNNSDHCLGMDAETRSAVEHELRRLRREHEEELARNNIHFNVKPPKAELRKCFIHNAVPFVAFGFLDNFILLIAGDAIESTFG